MSESSETEKPTTIHLKFLGHLYGKEATESLSRAWRIAKNHITSMSSDKIKQAYATKLVSEFARVDSDNFQKLLEMGITHVQIGDQKIKVAPEKEPEPEKILTG